jgi:hypothetical protein
MKRLVLIARALLALTGSASTTLAEAQMPKEMQETWCYSRSQGGAPELPELRKLPQRDWFYSMGRCTETKPNEPQVVVTQDEILVTPDEVISSDFRCAVIRVTKFDTCPWGPPTRRVNRVNPWGPGYFITLACKRRGSEGPTITVVRDWVIEKGALRLMRAPSGYRC